MNNKDFIENNQVTISGEIISNFSYSHEIFGEQFYTASVKVQRLSDSFDLVPIMVSERLMDVKENWKGQLIRINGQYRSYNRHEGEKNKLLLTVFAREVEVLEQVDEGSKNNTIYLEGYVCKKPVYRKTPLGREIADLLLAVNRPYGKSDYLPCICWGRNARYVSKLRVGEKCAVWGRIQSREYKKISETETETRMAYEVSVNKLEEIPDEK